MANKFSKRQPVAVNPILRHKEEQFLALDNDWLFRLDPKDEGKNLQWFKKAGFFKDKILVPGCWQGQGFGGEGKDEIWDFKIQTRVFRATYHGTGWYGKCFSVPKEWKGKRIWLNFGGVHPSAEIWLNGEKIGRHSGPFVPFGFDITEIVSFENDNFLAARIFEENRWLGLGYNWRGYWSGLYRDVEIKATGNCWFDRFWVHPDVNESKLKFHIQLGGNLELKSCLLSIRVSSLDGISLAEVKKKVNQEKELTFDIQLHSPQLWSPDNPNLYRVDAVLYQAGNIMDTLIERVGFVKLSTQGKKFLINDQPYYMRGTEDMMPYPETGSPDTNRERWRKRLSRLREYGYNYIRMSSYVPTPEYYDVADEVGLLVQGEMGMLGAWGGNSIWHVYAWPQPLPEYRGLLRYQWNHAVMRDVNHPSANMYCMSNELTGMWGKWTKGTFLFPKTAWQCYRETKRIKPSAFVIWTDGGYNSELPGEFACDEAEIDKECPLPVIQHEFRWWSSYPDVRIKDKYKGAIRPYAIEIAEEAAASNGMTHLLPHIAHNSQRLQYIEARTKLENCRRDNPTLAGICHDMAMDCGLTPEGIIDDFFETKYINAKTWRQTFGDTAILIDGNFNNRVFSGGEVFQSVLYVSDFSHPPLKHPECKWELKDGEKSLATGTLTYEHKSFCTHQIGTIKTTLPEVSRPLLIKLYVRIGERERVFSNQWSFWLFPKDVKWPESIGIYGEQGTGWLKELKDNLHLNLVNLSSGKTAQLILSERFDENMVKYASQGGRVFLVASEGLVRPFYPTLLEGRYFFTRPAEYPPYEDGNAGTIVQNHPMLADFPHEGFCDLQFYRMVAESPPISLDPLGSLNQEPVIRAFSSYFVCHPLAYLIELNLGKGGLIVSALNLDQSFPEARHLLSSILHYAVSDRFKPKDDISEQALHHLSAETRL